MTSSASDFPDFASKPAAKVAPVMPPLNLQEVEAAYLAQQDAAKALNTLQQAGSEMPSAFDSSAAGFSALLILFPVLLVIGLMACAVGGITALLPIALLILSVSAGGAKLLTTSHRLESAYAALALSEANPHWIAPCIASLQSHNTRRREIAGNLLIRLLPTAPPALLRNLSPAQRKALYGHLSLALNAHPELALAIIHAIERTEDTAAAPYLERAIPRFALPQRTRQVRQAAIRCGETLEAAETRERERLEALIGKTDENQSPEMTKEERAEAARVHSLVDALPKESRRLRKPGMRVGFLAATWLIIFPYCLMQFIDQLGVAGWRDSAALFWGAATLLATQSHRLTLLGRQSEAARQLANCESVRAVGPLAEALEWPDGQIQRVASAALIRLLPRLKASDASLLNPKQRAILYKVLRPMNSNGQSKLICAILAALEQVGDKAAVPAVSRLEAMLAITTAQRSVRAAAKRCLPYLNANAENARSSQTLLRASSAITTTPDMLLRPASSTPETPPEQLLRASSGE